MNIIGIRGYRVLRQVNTSNCAEDNTMNRRRLREQLRSRYIAQVRWWGWAMLMLFVLVQVAGAHTGH